MPIYQLQHSATTHGVPFDTFLQFFCALKTLCITPEHSSYIRYEFSYQTQTIYRTGQDAITTGLYTYNHARKFTCPTRPELVVYKYIYQDQIHRVKNGYKENITKTIVRVELGEWWKYITGQEIYVLTKTTHGVSKYAAVLNNPSFHMTIQSESDHCVMDLMGRFKHGRAETLDITHVQETHRHDNDAVIFLVDHSSPV